MRNIKRAGALVAATLSIAAMGAGSAVADESAKRDACRTESWGIGCYFSYGDRVAVRDWKADGKWVKAVVQTTSGRDLYCADKSSAGEERYCDYNISESERIRVRAELWDGNDFQTATGWSGWVSA